ncbi:MAG: terminase small subunit [Candidatus Omnitrophica bacterium]|nr:terminase small subunit [Candidatus Omnitrophota bacterium]
MAKHAGGRPLKFKTPKELEKKIDAYFDSCFRPLINPKTNEIVKDKNGNEIIAQYKPFTISGLAYALGTNRMTLLNYENKEEFSEIVTRAKERCEVYAEESLYDRDKWQGARFVLTNGFQGWETKETHKIEGIDEILSRRRKKE